MTHYLSVQNLLPWNDSDHPTIILEDKRGFIDRRNCDGSFYYSAFKNNTNNLLYYKHADIHLNCSDKN